MDYQGLSLFVSELCELGGFASDIPGSGCGVAALRRVPEKQRDNRPVRIEMRDNYPWNLGR